MWHKGSYFLFSTLSLIIASLLGVGGGLTGVVAENGISKEAGLSNSIEKVYLPLVTQPAPRVQSGSIWSHNTEAAAHEVTLFRHTFSLETSLTEAELTIFADTRYEVWIDGTWVGRGPARFSRQTREYDIYALDALSPGSHVLAVVVQWAPNYRRSESTTPFLWGELQGDTGSGKRVVARTGSHWKVQSSMAWQQDATPVHAWHLIGPTELLDLRKLPHDWMQPAFDDSQWAQSVVVTPPDAQFQPRSIPLLSQVPIPATVHDAGVLSPGSLVGELLPSMSTPYTIPFTATSSTELNLKVLWQHGVSPSDMVRLDNAALDWQISDELHPSIYNVSQSIESGSHMLTFHDIPAQGATFSISRQGVELTNIPFAQGIHAGRRSLLADLVSQPEEVASESSANGLALTFASIPAYAVLDLGRVVHGRIVADVSGPAGAVVDVGWDERLWRNKRPLPYPGTLHPEWNQVDSWVLDGTTRTISTLDARAGRYVLIAIWGKEPVRFENLRVYEERYPVDLQGSFHSSSDQLNTIWQVGVDTLYPNMTDAYADPWRERGQWWGDAYVADHVNQVAFGDTQLLRRGLLLMNEAFEDGQPKALAPNGDGNHLLDYGMLWVQSMEDYWRQTADLSLLRTAYPTLIEFIRYLEQYRHPVTGLLDMPLDNGPDRIVYIDTSVYFDRYGQSTAFNAFYYSTLTNAASMAERLGDAENAHLWRERAESLKTQVNRYLYRPEEGRYIQTIFQGKERAPSVHAQARALTYGLVPDDQTQRVANALLELLSSNPAEPNVQIYGMFWTLEALARAGRHDDAVRIINRYYGRLLDLGATTWWEHFNAHELYWSSLSHGWGGSPTWFLTTHVLGAHRTGVNTWSVKPSLSSVGFAEGTLPLADGILEVRWDRSDCAQIELDLVAPPATAGEVLLPLNDDDDALVITLNETTVWQDGMPLVDGIVANQEGILLPLSGGQHVLRVQRTCYPVYLPAIQR